MLGAGRPYPTGYPDAASVSRGIKEKPQQRANAAGDTQKGKPCLDIVSDMAAVSRGLAHLFWRSNGGGCGSLKGEVHVRDYIHRVYDQPLVAGR